MKARGISVLAVALLAGGGASAVADDLADLKAAHEKTLKAITTGDADGLLATFHEEQVRFDRGAQLATDYKGLSREAFRKSMAEGAASTEIYSITPVEVRYRVIGDTGIVWGYNVDVHKMKGEPGSARMSRMTAIYSRQGGQWKRVCTHVSEVPPAH